MAFDRSQLICRSRCPRWTPQNRPLVDRSKPAISGGGRDWGVLLRRLLGAQVGLDFGAPAARAALEDVRVMEQPIEERGDGGGVAEELAPVVDGPVRGQERATRARSGA